MIHTRVTAKELDENVFLCCSGAPGEGFHPWWGRFMSLVCVSDFLIDAYGCHDSIGNMGSDSSGIVFFVCSVFQLRLSTAPIE